MLKFLNDILHFKLRLFSSRTSWRIAQAWRSGSSTLLTDISEVFESVAESMGEGLVVLERNGRFVFSNHFAREILGVDTHSLTVQEWLQRFGQQGDVAEMLKSVDPAALLSEGKNVSGVELRVRNPEKKEDVWISLNGRPVSDQEGAVQGAVIVFRDITDRKNRHAELQSSEARLRSIIDSAHDAFIAITTEGRISEWNKRAEGMFGWNRTEVIGRPLSKVIIPERFREAHEHGMKRFLQTGQGPVLNTRIELAAVHRKGYEIPVEMTISAVPVGDTFLFTAFLHDISERTWLQKIATTRVSVTEALADAETLSEGIARTLETICNGLGWQAADMCVPSADRRSLVCEESFCLTSDRLRKFMAATRSFCFAKGEGLPGRVWESGKAAWIADISKDTGFTRQKEASEARIQSAMAFPIWYRDSIGGIMEFFTVELTVPDEKILKLMEDIGSQIGQFIQRKRAEVELRSLYRDLEKHVDERTRQLEEANLALTESKEAYQILAEAIPQIVWTAEGNGEVTYVNSKWREFAGNRSPGRRDWQQSVHPLDSERAIGKWRESIDAGTHYQAEARMRRASDGVYRWHLIRALPFRDQSGKVIKWFGTNTDIDDQKRSEEKQRFLAEASSALSSSMDYTSTLRSVAKLGVPQFADWCSVHILEEGRLRQLAVAHRDPSKVELAWELEKKYPTDPESPTGVPQVVRSAQPEMISEITDAMLDGGGLDPEHHRIIKSLGLRSYVCVPLLARDQVFGAMTFISAESQRKYDQLDLEFAVELGRRAALAVDNSRLFCDAQAASQAKDEFLATLSHELRTPLNVILGWVHLLRTEKMDELSFKQALDTLERNAQVQVKLIGDLLDVSRIVSGKLSLEIKPVDINSVVAEGIASVLPLRGKAKIHVNAQTAQRPVLVAGDLQRLQQVVWNLLSNAAKFTPQGGAIDVWVKQDATQVEIRVRDTGRGIDPRFLPHVFDTFRQEDSSTTRSHGGLGLGLSIVRHLVELHGGTVNAESAGKGCGATFTVRLPILVDYQGVAVNKTPVGQPLGVKLLEGVKILLVDDSPDVLSLISLFLKKQGASVRAVSSAPEALEAIGAFHPDVLLSDIGMPGEDGYTLIRKIRASPNGISKIPAAALTAYAREEERRRALDAGFQLHLAKPIGSQALTEGVLKLLELRL